MPWRAAASAVPLPPATGARSGSPSEVAYRCRDTLAYLAYLAADDVHAARVIGRTAPTTGIEPFGSWSSR